MSAHDSRRTCRNSRPPAVELLETRALASAGGAVSAQSAHTRPRATTVAFFHSARVESPNGLFGKRAPGPFLDPAVIAQAAVQLYPPGGSAGTPTPREIRRQIFTARWIGQYTIGPPRFSDRASIIHLYGVDGGSNQFLIGKFQISLDPPADPSASPTPGDPYANQVVGVAALFPQNYLQTGALLTLDLNAMPAAGSTAGALPSHLTWTYDTNASASNYSAPLGIVGGASFTQGTGTLDIRYLPSARSVPSTLGSGRVIVTLQGLINTSQITSPVSKFIS
jgi:hypothetical protein